MRSFPGLPSFLHHLATLPAPHRHRQYDLGLLLQEQFDDERYRRIAAQAIRRSGIETRHTVLESYFDHGPFDEKGQAPTSARNDLYATESRRLATRLARNILESPGAPDAEEITHVIFTTCTGFVNPGPEFHMVADLGLSENVERYTIGFMGCYGAFPTLRMADQFCRARPDARVLFVCLELCTLHMQLDARPDAILGNVVFADGAAGGIVSSDRVAAETSGGYRLDRFATATLPDGESSMAWSIGDRGFDLVLSSYVPKVIGAEIGDVLERTGFSPDEIDRYAIHPGGKAILDRVESALDLPEHALDFSREILRDYGNMSSATILFVLERMLESSSDPDRLLAMAFGPGLTVETAGLTAVPAGDSSTKSPTESESVAVDHAADSSENAPLTL